MKANNSLPDRRLRAEAVRDTLEQLACWDNGTQELTDLLEQWHVPAACAPSLMAARRAFSAAEAHLRAAAVIADDLCQGRHD
ncbi:MAG: hypothetical protein RLZZ32_1784 [Cyanobacteriota bacterium]|jgi:hypothetical protein